MWGIIYRGRPSISSFIAFKSHDIYHPRLHRHLSSGEIVVKFLPFSDEKKNKLHLEKVGRGGVNSLLTVSEIQIREFSLYDGFPNNKYYMLLFSTLSIMFGGFGPKLYLPLCTFQICFEPSVVHVIVLRRICS